MTMFVSKAAVVGAGTMGAEIAHLIANAGIPVVLKDADEQRVEQGLSRARALSQALLDAGNLEPAELERRLALITPSTDYGPFGDVDFVIEAVPERIELKQLIFSELDEATPGQAILATNTSSLSITEIGEATTRADKVVGFHFFFPASVSRLVEVTEGDDTSAETAQAAVVFAQAIRKTAIRCRETPGFVVNRILNSSVAELWRAQEEAGIEAHEFDRLLVESGGMKVGPLYVSDLLGLDTCLFVAEYLVEAYGDRFYVHKGMRERVQAGELGAKTGKGFYEHGG
jgi:3-hydroxyacyl-CoA dehydrogenase